MDSKEGNDSTTRLKVSNKPQSKMKSKEEEEFNFGLFSMFENPLEQFINRHICNKQALIQYLNALVEKAELGTTKKSDPDPELDKLFEAVVSRSKKSSEELYNEGAENLNHSENKNELKVMMRQLLEPSCQCLDDPVFVQKMIKLINDNRVGSSINTEKSIKSREVTSNSRYLGSIKPAKDSDELMSKGAGSLESIGTKLISDNRVDSSINTKPLITKSRKNGDSVRCAKTIKGKESGEVAPNRKKVPNVQSKLEEPELLNTSRYLGSRKPAEDSEEMICRGAGSSGSTGTYPFRKLVSGENSSKDTAEGSSEVAPEVEVPLSLLDIPIGSFDLHSTSKFFSQTFDDDYLLLSEKMTDLELKRKKMQMHGPSSSNGDSDPFFPSLEKLEQEDPDWWHPDRLSERLKLSRQYTAARLEAKQPEVVAKEAERLENKKEPKGEAKKAFGVPGEEDPVVKLLEEKRSIWQDFDELKKQLGDDMFDNEDFRRRFALESVLEGDWISLKLLVEQVKKLVEPADPDLKELRIKAFVKNILFGYDEDFYHIVMKDPIGQLGTLDGRKILWRMVNFVTRDKKQIEASLGNPVPEKLSKVESDAFTTEFRVNPNPTEQQLSQLALKLNVGLDRVKRAQRAWMDFKRRRAAKARK